jgi:hypothetical protein
MNSLNLQELQQALQEAKTASACLVAVGASFELHVTVAFGVAILVDEKGKPWTFAQPAEAMPMLESLGIHEMPWLANEEQLYELWLRQKVNASIAGLADGTNRLYSQDEWKAVKAARAARRKGA